MRRKSKIIKRNFLLLFLIGVSILSYKGYKYYDSKIVQADKIVAATKNKATNNVKAKIDNNEKKQKLKEDKTKDNLSNVNSEGQKYTYDVKKVKDILDKKVKKDGKKIAFLTFDDGPSTTVTPKILNVLKDYNVKATFCLLGENVDSNKRSKKIVKRIFDEGHALANHTYSHKLKRLYPHRKVNVEYYMEEVEKTNAAIRNVVGQNFNTRVIRMPGGYMSRKYYKDPNLPQFNNALAEKGMYSIDWNAYDYDSEGKRKNADELLEYVKESVGNQEKVIILMHDTYGKEQTAKALPKIIEYLKAKGYEFRTMS